MGKKENLDAVETLGTSLWNEIKSWFDNGGSRWGRRPGWGDRGRRGRRKGRRKGGRKKKGGRGAVKVKAHRRKGKKVKAHRRRKPR